MKGCLTDIASSFRLLKGPVVGIQIANGFDNAVVEVAAVLLPAVKAPDIYGPQIFIRIPLVHPLGQGPACTARAGDAN